MHLLSLVHSLQLEITSPHELEHFSPVYSLSSQRSFLLEHIPLLSHSEFGHLSHLSEQASP